MNINEQALFQALLSHIEVTEKLLEDHIRLVQSLPEFSPSPALANMLVTIRSLRQRMQAIVNP